MGTSVITFSNDVYDQYKRKPAERQERPQHKNYVFPSVSVGNFHQLFPGLCHLFRGIAQITGDFFDGYILDGIFVKKYNKQCDCQGHGKKAR
jgi:hypothetical protein